MTAVNPNVGRSGTSSPLDFLRKGATGVEIDPAMAPKLRPVVELCCRFDPTERPQNGAALVAALNGMAATRTEKTGQHGPVRTTTAVPATTMTPAVGRRRWWPAMVLACCCVVATSTIVPLRTRTVGISNPSPFAEAIEWVQLPDRLILRLPPASGRGARWSLEGGSTTVQGPFVHDGGALLLETAVGDAERLVVHRADGVAESSALIRPTTSFAVAPTIRAGFAHLELSWKLHGRAFVTVTADRRSGAPVASRTTRDGTVVLSAEGLAADDRHLVWRILLGDRLLAEGEVSLGLSVRYELPFDRRTAAKVLGRPLAQPLPFRPTATGDGLVIAWRYGLVTGLAAAPSRRGTELRPVLLTAPLAAVPNLSLFDNGSNYGLNDECMDVHPDGVGGAVARLRVGASGYLVRMAATNAAAATTDAFAGAAVYRQPDVTSGEGLVPIAPPLEPAVELPLPDGAVLTAYRALDDPGITVSRRRGTVVGPACRVEGERVLGAWMVTDRPTVFVERNGTLTAVVVERDPPVPTRVVPLGPIGPPTDEWPCDAPAPVAVTVRSSDEAFVAWDHHLCRLTAELVPRSIETPLVPGDYVRALACNEAGDLLALAARTLPSSTLVSNEGRLELVHLRRADDWSATIMALAPSITQHPQLCHMDLFAAPQGLLYAYGARSFFVLQLVSAGYRKVFEDLDTHDTYRFGFVSVGNGLFLATREGRLVGIDL